MSFSALKRLKVTSDKIRSRKGYYGVWYALSDHNIWTPINKIVLNELLEDPQITIVKDEMKGEEI